MWVLFMPSVIKPVKRVHFAHSFLFNKKYSALRSKGRFLHTFVTCLFFMSWLARVFSIQKASALFFVISQAIFMKCIWFILLNFLSHSRCNGSVHAKGIRGVATKNAIFYLFNSSIRLLHICIEPFGREKGEHLNYTKIRQRKYTSSYATGHMWGNNEKVLDIIYNFLNYLDLGGNKIKLLKKKS